MSNAGLQQLMHANVLDEFQLQDVRMMMEAYPYFPLPYLLLARHYYHTGHPDFQAALLHASARVQNRSFLKDFVESGLPEMIHPVNETAEASHPLLLPEQAESMEPVPVFSSVLEENAVLEVIPVSETPVLESVPIPVLPENKPQVPESEKGNHRPATRSIHFGLQTKISIRAGQYSGLGGKIRAQLDSWRLSLGAPQEPVSLPEPETQLLLSPAEEILQLPAVEISALPLLTVSPEPNDSRLLEAPLPISELPETVEISRLPEHTLVPGVSEYNHDDTFVAYGDDTWILDGMPEVKTMEEGPGGDGLPLFVIEASEEADREAEELILEYEIGQFAAFDFFPVPVPEDSESNTPAGKPEEGLSIEIHEDQRILHVSLTKEQLEKYFEQSPASEPKQQTKEKLVTRDERVAGTFEIKLSRTPKDIPSRNRRSREEYSRILDQFIETEPTISRKPAGEVKENLAKDSIREDQELATETLARIHARQGNTQKAIRMYEKLMLLFPEKVSYFEAEIQKLRSC